MSTALPEGFLYVPAFVSTEEEAELIGTIRELPLETFTMHGVTSRRRVMHYGWLYGYETWRLTPGSPIPEGLLGLRRRAATLGGLEDAALEEALVTEYAAGAGIGWHRDAPMFGIVVAISLGGRCYLRFQRGKGAERQTAKQELEPRSAYLLSGSARSDWQHSIPPTKELRYSVTFRTVRRTT